MADKRISDLDATSVLSDDDIFLVRKTSQNEDFKITKSSLVSNLSNPGIVGFSATATGGEFTLTPLNGATITGYLNGMKISFISPVSLYSQHTIRLRIGNNAFVSFLSQLRGRTYPNMDLNEYYEGVYRNGSFYHTNPKEVNYTNETTGSGVISNNTTTYTLTSATGFYRRSYYPGMSVLFTSNIDSTDLVYINLDSLGAKLLSDPDGDGVPFSLVKNQTIMAIYDGTKFIKNSFTMQEPELPFDPSEPVIIYVGPNEEQVSNTTLQRAIDRILWDYGPDGGGRKVIIRFRDDYSGEGYYTSPNQTMTKNYITIEGNPNVTMQPSPNVVLSTKPVIDASKLQITLTGEWKMNFPLASSTGLSQTYSFLIPGIESCIINDATITNINNGYQNYNCFAVYAELKSFVSTNCTVINFGYIFGSYREFYDGIRYDEILFTNFTIKNTIATAMDSNNRRVLYLKYMSGVFDNLKLIITKPNNFDNLIYCDGNNEIKNTTILSTQTAGPLIQVSYARPSSSQQLILTNCVIKYSGVVNTKSVIVASGGVANGYIPSQANVIINSGNFQSPNSATIPDIVAESRSKITIKTSEVVGRAIAQNGGVITNV